MAWEFGENPGRKAIGERLLRFPEIRIRLLILDRVGCVGGVILIARFAAGTAAAQAESGAQQQSSK
jgi:hypothetical protein